MNLPSIFVYGGTIMPGNWNGKQVTIQDVYEAVGSYDAGKMNLEEIHKSGKCCMSRSWVLWWNVYCQYYGFYR